MSDTSNEKEAGSTIPVKDTNHPKPSSREALKARPIQLRAEDLYDKEKVDLETVVVDDVFKLLQCDEGGLTDEEAVRRLELFGPNRLESEEQNAFLQFLSFMWNPLSWVMEAAALVAIALSNGEGQPPDWEDFVGIVLLLFINSAIGFYEERNAGNAVKALMDSLAPKAKVKRAGSWKEIDSADLVPGDMVSFKIGDIVPADCRLTEAINISIDQAALTGESLPQSKKMGDQCFSVKRGRVISTGPNTFFATSWLNNILVLLIGGIPIAMPTVLSVTLAVGYVTRITAIEELAAVTILCSDKTGTLTTNKLTIDRNTIRTYGPYSAEDVVLLAAYASRTENQDAIDSCVVGAIGDPARARAGIKLLDFKPFNPVDKRTEITYREESSGKLKRVTKGMTGIIIELCTRNKTDEVENKLEADVEEFATRGLRALAVAYEDVDGDDPEGEGNGFELIGLLAIFDPPREDTKQTIDDAIALGVRVKMVTGDQLAIAKETGRRLGLGDHMYPAKMILDADGFAGVFPEHKYEIVKRLQGLGISRSVHIVHAIRGSRVIFQRMRNYSIYACAVTIRIVVCFSILAFAFKFDFPPFMVLIIALLNDGTIMTSPTPDSWDLAEIFSYAVAYGLYLTLSTIALVAICIRETWFYDKFGVTFENGATSAAGNHNDRVLHAVVYLQRPSTALLCAFCLAQLVSTIIAVYADWGFTDIHGISGGWVGIVWVWDIVWFIPLDWIKFAMKATVIKKLRARHLAAQAQGASTGVPITRTQSRAASLHESLYSNRVSFIRRAARKVGFGTKVSMKPEELQRFSSIQAARSGATLARNPSRQAA
ncbi:plasma-membrane proton-e [Amylocystis lapponica]|nr:plasma-membrane proton-e [Amylocystis lapponica]